MDPNSLRFDSMVLRVAVLLLLILIPSISFGAVYPGESLDRSVKSPTSGPLESMIPFEGVSIKRSKDFVIVKFPDISRAGEGNDILGWPVFSKTFHALLGDSGDMAGIELRQIQRVGDWRISKTVIFRPSDGLLTTSYEFTTARGVVSARREEVTGVTGEVIKRLAEGDFNFVNAMTLGSRVFTGHLPPVAGTWLLKP